MGRKSLAPISAAIIALGISSCSESPLVGEWKCNDFVISDTAGIPSNVIEDGIISAKSTTLTINEDSTYQEDYIVEETEIISTIGAYSIKGDSIYFFPERLGGKELTDTSAIVYEFIANNERLSEIAFPKKYQLELKDSKLILMDMIYGGVSRNKTNKTYMYFGKEEK